MKGKPIVVGLVVGLTLVLCTNAGMAFFSKSVSPVKDFIAQTNLLHIGLALFGGFFMGAFLSGIVETKKNKIEPGSRSAYLAVGLGTWIVYLILGWLFF
jgi:hypothetical protein